MESLPEWRRHRPHSWKRGWNGGKEIDDINMVAGIRLKGQHETILIQQIKPKIEASYLMQDLPLQHQIGRDLLHNMRPKPLKPRQKFGIPGLLMPPGRHHDR